MTTIRQLIADGTITLDTVVLGTLPMTADGCIIGYGCTLWYRLSHTLWYRSSQEIGPDQIVDMRHQPIKAMEPSYSTREAAEAARKGTP